MKFQFKYLGAIDNAEVELAPLTIICGKNNTGKTYVTYAIYALLDSWRELIDWKMGDEEMTILRNEGSVSIDMELKFVSKWSEIRSGIGKRWREFLSTALAAPAERFKTTELTFDVNIDDHWKKPSFRRDFRSDSGKPLFTAQKGENSSIIELVALKEETTTSFPTYALEAFTTQVLLESVLSHYIPSAFMVSTERTGAVAFKEELNLTKNKIVTLLASIEQSKETQLHPGKLFDAVYKRGYPLPVEANVRFVNKFGSLEGQVGNLLKEHPDLASEFDKIAGGKYETDKDGITRFVPKGASAKLQLGEASSAARSLVVFWYWLKTQASKGDMLLIDEPELNLHPENQRAFARFLAKLVNLGIRVILTTHSDTIVREFNTLIMFSRNLPHMESARREFGYADGESLNPNDVSLYVANGKARHKNGRQQRNAEATLERVMVDPKIGLAVEIFDATIIEMGRVQDALRYGAI